MDNIIGELSENQRKYFWSKPSEEKILVGGYTSTARFYGQVEFEINQHCVLMKTHLSDGVSSSISLATREYSNGTEEFRVVSKLFNEIDDYLMRIDIQTNQEVERDQLMKNLLDFLPPYQG